MGEILNYFYDLQEVRGKVGDTRLWKLMVSEKQAE